jgi:glutaminyl-tRNA synthetase
MNDTVDTNAPKTTTDDAPGNFVRERVAEELQQKKLATVTTRFPPEPNGYLHIGHAKAICLNFGIAKEFGGTCNLRFDDTNPEKESDEYVRAIKHDIAWLGFEWGDSEVYASSYFGQLYDFATAMIERGEAYVDDRPMDEIRKTRGDFHTAGQESPGRARSVAENLDLFTRMKQGEFADGAMVLRAKGDMQSTDMKLRDPVMYRIRHVHHHRTGDAWCIYPLYDWAHGQSDWIERITHSLCSLEFVNHRPLYNFFLDRIGAPADVRPQQIEFAKLQLNWTVLSKRRLLELVNGNHVEGWDDPRMPTLAGLRRRGVPPEALRAFCERVGVSTRNSEVDITLLEHAIRESLNATSPRVMAVLRPLKLVIENFPEGEVIEFDSPYDPEKPDGPSRKVPFSRELYIEQEDFAENPPKKFFRLAPGQEVRLRYACLVRCTSVVKDAAGQVTEVRCTWDPESRGGAPADGRKVKGTLHWVSAAHAVSATVRLFDRLWTVPNPLGAEDPSTLEEGGAAKEDRGWLAHLNPSSVEVLEDVKLEPSLAAATPGQRLQFERIGYFVVDDASAPGALRFNRTISLKDTWQKEVAKSKS